MGDAVRLGSPVRRISQGAGGAVVHAEGGTFSARRVVVAVPPALAVRIAYDPPLPPDRDQLTQRYAMGAVVKCHAVYDEPFWRHDGLSGTASSDKGFVRVTFDNSPPSGTPGVLLAFVEGRAARELTRLDETARRETVVEELAEFFGPRARDPQQFHAKAWAEDEWSRGCYAGNLPPGAWTQFGDAVRRPAGVVHWAGTESATVWNGYMEGAVRAGERAANEVLTAIS
jgi:monoamine oxidase